MVDRLRIPVREPSLESSGVRDGASELASGLNSQERSVRKDAMPRPSLSLTKGTDMCELPPAEPDDLSALDEIDTADDLLEYLDRLEVRPVDRAPAPTCNHRSIRLITPRRTVVCRDCEEMIDPFSALLIFTSQWDRYQRQLNDLKVKVYLKHGELFELEQEEEAIKTRLDEEDTRDAGF